MAKTETAKKTKRPTALKRHLQSLKRRGRNRVYKARVRGAIREAETQQERADVPGLEQSVKEVYSLLDRCVKRGVFKVNKAARIKSRLMAGIKRKESA